MIYKFKYYISLFLLLSIFNNISAQTPDNKINPEGYNVFYFDNGIKSSEGNMRNGKPDGYWKNYYPTGIIKNEGNRREFVLDSIWKFYNERGKIQKSFTYREGKKNGFSTVYDTSGLIISKENYENDIKNGNTYTYYKSGKLKQIIPFKNGKADGVSNEFSQDSIVISIIIYKYGFIERQEKINRTDKDGKKQGIWKEFYNDGKVKKEERFKDNQVDGYLKEFDEKGDLKNIEKFSYGKKVKDAPELVKPEIFRLFYENGNIKFEGAYFNGMPQGIHYHFNEIGKPDSAIIYQDGYQIEKGAVDTGRQRQGPWVEFYLTGEEKGKGSYKNHLKLGEWKYYHTNAKIEQIGKYNKSGKPTGEWKWYYESGNILREENYLDGNREGLMQEFTEEGKIITKGEFFDDLQEGPWYYEMVNYKEYGNYKAGLPDSVWKAYYIKENKLRFEGAFNTGDPDGKHAWYYPDGRIQFTGKYAGGMKHGDWKHYDENGLWDLTITYDADMEVKWDGVKVLPTYEESLRVYDTAKKKAVPEKIIEPEKKIKKSKKEDKATNEEEPEEE